LEETQAFLCQTQKVIPSVEYWRRYETSMTGYSESFGESRSQSRHDRIIDQRPRKHDFQEPPERRGGLGAGLIICAVGNDPSKESRLRRLREVWISRLKMKRAVTRSDCWLSAASASGK
jgi:hypothetical protein